MAGSDPLYLVMFTVMGFVVVMGMALLALFYLISTKTSNKRLCAAMPAFVMLAGFLWLKDVDASDIVAASVLFVAPMAALLVPFLFPEFTGPRTGANRIAACGLIVSLVAVGFTFFFMMSGLAMVPWIYWHTPVSNGLVYGGLVLGYTAVAAGIYAAMRRAGVLGEKKNST